MIKQDLLVSIPDHHIMNASLIAVKQNKPLYDVILEAITIGIKHLQADVYVPPPTSQMVEDPAMDRSIRDTISRAKDKIEELEEVALEEFVSQEREVSIMSDGSFEI